MRASGIVTTWAVSRSTARIAAGTQIQRSPSSAFGPLAVRGDVADPDRVGLPGSLIGSAFTAASVLPEGSGAWRAG